MARPDLFNLARDNGGAISDRLQTVLEGLDDEGHTHLTEFVAAATRAMTIAQNVDPGRLILIIESGEIRNCHEVAQHKAAASGVSPDEALREMLGTWFTRRMAFEGHFENGPGFRYAALYLDGLGAQHFGRLCCVLKRDFPGNKQEAAYLAHDSLKGYVTERGEIRQDELGRDIASHLSRAALAAVKKGAKLAGSGNEDWGRTICGSGDYIESIYLQKAKPKDLECVRFPRSYAMEAASCHINHLLGRASDSEKVMAKEYNEVTALLAEKGIQRENLPDD